MVVVLPNPDEAVFEDPNPVEPMFEDPNTNGAGAPVELAAVLLPKGFEA